MLGNKVELKGVPPSVRIGSVLNNRFVLKALLGEGGMGKVFKAIDLRREEVHDTNPYVAIKLLNDDVRRVTGAMMALQREAVVAQTLKHTGIASVYDYNRDESHAYIVMELIEGYTLDQFIIASYPDGIPAPQSYQLINKLIQAVLFAHEQGVIHADIKPSNIKVLPNGDVKLMDFGLARVVSLMSVSPNAIDNILSPLTPSYATVARLNGRQPVKVDDMYALGCVIYLILTGRHPYLGMSPDKALKTDINPARPGSLSRLQWRALQQALDPNIEKESQAINVLSVSFSAENNAKKKLKQRVLVGALAILMLMSLLSVFNWFHNDFPVWNIRYSDEAKRTQLLDAYLLKRSEERDLSIKEIYFPILIQQWDQRWGNKYSLSSTPLRERYQQARLLQHDLSTIEQLSPVLPNSNQLVASRKRLEQVRANTVAELLNHYENQLTSYLNNKESPSVLSIQLLVDDFDLLKSLTGTAEIIQSDPRLLFIFHKEIKKEWGARRYLPLVEKLLLAQRLFPENSEFDEALALVNLKVSSGIANSENKRIKIMTMLDENTQPSLTYSPVYDEILESVYLASGNKLDLNPLHRDLFENTKQRYFILGGNETTWEKMIRKAKLQYGRKLAQSGRISEAYALIDNMMATSLR